MSSGFREEGAIAPNRQVSEDAEHFMVGRSIKSPTEFEIEMHQMSAGITIARPLSDCSGSCETCLLIVS